jgi:hypothetical protein
MIIDKDGKTCEVFVVGEGSSKDDLITKGIHEGIHINDTYKIVYENGRKPKRKVIETVDGLNLLMGIQRYESLFNSFLNEPEMKNIPLTAVQQTFRDEMKSIVEVWGCERMGLSTPKNPIPKENKKDIKKDKDCHWLFLVFGFYGVNLLNHISKDSSNDDCRTITVTDSVVTEKEFEGMTINKKKWTDEDKGWLKETMMDIGCFTYSYSS